jgi:hypothetical protein
MSLFEVEPQKTFKKVGITDESGTLTAEGRDLILQHYFRQNEAAIKTEVADPILAAIEAEEAKGK